MIAINNDENKPVFSYATSRWARLYGLDAIDTIRYLYKAKCG